MLFLKHSRLKKEVKWECDTLHVPVVRAEAPNVTIFGAWHKSNFAGYLRLACRSTPTHLKSGSVSAVLLALAKAAARGRGAKQSTSE
jgi:hypothetical protein